MKRIARQFLKDTGGATAIEYSLIAAGISLAIVAAVFIFGDGLQGLFEAMPAALSAATAEIETSR